ncbi:hypothetical protein J6590_017526 [Homalodisca vitripennis]|nr:hypothetical protein J6590_017526 [Homalodisca vitripennis]
MTLGKSVDGLALTCRAIARTNRQAVKDNILSRSCPIRAEPIRNHEVIEKVNEPENKRLSQQWSDSKDDHSRETTKYGAGGEFRSFKILDTKISRFKMSGTRIIE